MMRAQQAEGISTHDYQVFKKLPLQQIKFFWVFLYLDTQSLSFYSINLAAMHSVCMQLGRLGRAIEEISLMTYELEIYHIHIDMVDPG